MEYISLFGLSFLAGSFLPAASEVYFVYLMQQEHNLWVLLISASVGNTLGGLTCYGIARYGGRALIKKFLKEGDERLDYWEQKLRSRSEWTALFAWLPILGEVIAAVIGLIPGRIIYVIIFMFTGKLLRYVFLYQLSSSL